jgi:hypothetical protein
VFIGPVIGPGEKDKDRPGSASQSEPIVPSTAAGAAPDGGSSETSGREAIVGVTGIANGETRGCRQWRKRVKGPKVTFLGPFVVHSFNSKICINQKQIAENLNVW